MKLQAIAVILVSTTIAGIFVIFGRAAYPPATTEGKLYVVPAIQFANKGLLNSPFLSEEWAVPSKTINPYPGARRMLYYPPLLPLALGSALGDNATPEKAFLLLAFLNIVVLAVSGFLLYKAVTFGGRPLTWLGALCVIFGLLGIATNIHAENGRPEALARLFIALAAAGLFLLPKKYHWVLFGMALGLVGATHTMGTVMFGLLSAAVLAVEWGPKKALVLTLLVALVGMGLFAIIVESGPYTVSETIRGVWDNANSLKQPAVVGQEKISLTYIRDYYLLNPNTSFYGPFILLLLLFVGVHYAKHRREIASQKLFLLWASLFAFLTFGFLFYFIHLYYIILFAPITFAFVSYYAVKTRGFLKYATVAIIGLTGIGFLRSVLLFPSFIKDGVLLQEARSRLEDNESVHGPRAKVGITESLWAVFKDFDNNKFVYLDYPASPPEGTTAILFQERYMGENSPPSIPGCEMKENYFVSKNVRLWKLKLANRVPGYAFALYECGRLHS